MSKRLDVRDILERGGGPRALHERSKELAVAAKRRREPIPPVIAEKTIYSWFENGIPEKHWWFVMPECRASEGELHKANEALRRRPSQRAPARAAA